LAQAVQVKTKVVGSRSFTPSAQKAADQATQMAVVAVAETLNQPLQDQELQDKATQGVRVMLVGLFVSLSHPTSFVMPGGDLEAAVLPKLGEVKRTATSLAGMVFTLRFLATT
jgi:hypothetical protein